MKGFAVLLLGMAFSLNAFSQELKKEEVRAILRHGPWPAPWQPDPSNRASGNPAAIALGERLFFDPRLSPSGKVLCATCHVPYRGWQDARARALGLAEVERNTPSVLNVRYARWFGWDGAGDSLWAQSLRPILEPREMGGSIAQAAALARGDAELACRIERAFGALPGDDAGIAVAIGKALAAFQETLVTGRTPFDEFRDALARGDADAMKRYPAAALRGLRIFIGKGNCSLCHSGPAFSNGEFNDTGVPFFVAGGGVDPGRHGGIKKLLSSPFNLLGGFNDDPAGKGAVRTRHVALEHRNFGQFKVPALRNVARTAPYMHGGSLATLADVVRHYSEVSPDRLHADGEVLLLRPLRLSSEESADLVAFLESLTETQSALPASRPESPCLK
ncbi:MAG: cytochrome c peroxidase [Pseudomonadota bacterium]